MSKGFFFYCFFIFINVFVFAQSPDNRTKSEYYLSTKGEVFFSFQIRSLSELKEVSSLISISEETRPQSLQIYAYANRQEFEEFLKLNYSYSVLVPPGDLLQNPKMFSSFSKEIFQWDAYPTYQTYLDMMYSYQAAYPALCKIIDAGNSVNGRKILFSKLTNTVSANQRKPKIMICSTIHGDELVGYVLTLRLIDYLVSTYGQSTKSTDLLDNFEIWINPLLNPDGVYINGNNSVSGGTRYNANNVDLNRCYPVMPRAAAKSQKSVQLENLAVMGLTDTVHFVLSAGLHTGSEVVNYPWDIKVQRNPDDAWWQYVSKMYADTAKVHGPASNMTDVNATGYTNGFDWYTIDGGQQDFMNYYRHCREFTLELSAIKTPIPSSLPDLWEANYRSLLNYIHEAAYGFNGTVTDSVSGQPLVADVNISGHDADNTDVFSYAGNYFRPIAAGTYNVSFFCTGYTTKTIQVSSINSFSNSVNVQLHTGDASVNALSQDEKLKISPNPAISLLNINYFMTKQSFLEISLINLQGESRFNDFIEKFQGQYQKSIDVSGLSPGFYILKIRSEFENIVRKVCVQ